MKLTPGTMSFFLKLVRSTAEWGECPLLEGITEAEKGYLTDLKRKGLVRTEVQDGPNGRPQTWVWFTASGDALRATLPKRLRN